MTHHSSTPLTVVEKESNRGWAPSIAAAEELVPRLGRLFRKCGIVVTVHGRSLLGESPAGIVKAHRFARRIDDIELPLTTTLEVVNLLECLDVPPCVVDVARLASLGDQASQIEELRSVPDLRRGAPRDVVLYGFGRIGRLVARILLERGEDPLGPRLRAVVVRGDGPTDLVKRASLLRRDSVHGPFRGTIQVDPDVGGDPGKRSAALIVNGKKIRFITSDAPGMVNFAELGIQDALLIDSTGQWRDPEGLAMHLRSPGVARVLLTAPGKDLIKNVVYGLNEVTLTPQDLIVSAASCTTNAVAPVLSAVDERFGIERGHIETVHSFTNDQNLIDNYHQGDRRGRSAVLNMVIAETGAAQAVAKALPQLAGRLTGNSIRVPTPDVSLAILHLTLSEPCDKARLNGHLRDIALHSGLREQVDYVESPEVVSSDFIGSHRTGVVDGLATIAPGTREVVLYVWYDNERGYSEQVVRVADTMLGLSRPNVPTIARIGAPVT